MNINELDNYDLGDAVKFNDRLNPALWTEQERLRPEVRAKLMAAAEDFATFLGVTDFDLKDITVSGSNAAYTYTPHSDIDLHLVVDLPEADASEVFRELFDAKKYQYNDMHNIKIKGYDVELYVQNANQPHVSQGIYSVLNDEWVQVPRRRKVAVDDVSTRSKYETLAQHIEQATASKDLERITALANKIKKMRQSGLETQGEFGPENLAFKMLRTQGLIDKLYAARNAAKDQMLSLDERRKKKKKKARAMRWGHFGGYWYPGTGYAGQDTPAAQAAGDGGGDGGAESIKEDAGATDEEILKSFIDFVVKELKIENMPRVFLRRDPEWPKRNKTFGRYNDDAKTLEVAWGNRHIMDVLRTVAHELTHKHQHEREDVPPSAGETGSEYENEANARAGVLMRDWARLHPEHFDAGQAHDLEESASGYIPTKKQSRDPRFSMALTVDIRPGQVGKEANKLKLKTDRQGHPQIARANGLFENLYKEYHKFKAAEDYSPDDPPGPEFRPTMPAGTLRVDVSDMYDWYKLGQHIANMKGLGHHDFGAGPPSTIVSFGDEDTEHEFIGDIKATGLDVTDIDPASAKKPAGKKIKTDPTYNVDEVIQAPISKEKKAEQEYLRFIMAKVNSGRLLNRYEQQYLKDYQAKKKLAEDKDLDEVKMSPGALEKFATSPEAKGIRAGFEAELIFRDTQGESEELDPEPNYDADERAYSIQQVIEFFENDEYGYGLSDRQRNRLENDLDERYMEWRDEQIISDFRNDAEDLIRDILLEETPMDQRIHFYLTDSLQMSDEEADAVIKAGAEAPRFTNSDAQKDYADENPEYKAYLEAADEAEQELEESVEFSVNRQDEYWDEALDKYRDDYSGDDDSFFSDVGLRWMSDVANEFNLDWPVWDGGGQQNYGSRNWEDIGNSLQDVVDMPVVVSSNYHTTKRRPGQWIIEPDGSLDPDDKSEEAGLEIVSPPMPLLTAIEKLRAVTDWANDPNGGNAYTNSSTGLHMGVSLPSMKSEATGDDIGIDYVKLILFMGDKYVQQQFGREANTYCASALEKLKQNIKGKKSDPAGVVKLLQHGLTELAYKELQKGVGTSKYTSAHIQPGYIEFRSPGGDWLAKADEEIGVLENTMLRFARAMAIAGDPNAERQEYAKKLYKLVTEDNPEYADQLRLFSEFSAGTINKEQLKKQWADTVLQKELPSVGKDEYEVYRRDNVDSPDATVGTLYAKDYDDAYDQFLRQYGRDINDLDVRIKQPWFDVFDDKGRVVKTLRAKDIDKATERAQYEFGERWTDAWNIYRRPDDTPEPKASPRAQVAKRIATKPKAPTQYNYDIIDQRTLDLKAIDRFYAANDQEASRVFDQWLKMKNLPNDTANYGYRRSAKAVSDDEASDWEAVYVPTGNVFDTLAHADAEQARTWAQSMGDAVRPEDIQVRRVGHQQAADARRDSVDLQRNLGVQDVDIDVTQNFAAGRENYELYQQDDPDRIIHRMPYATAEEVRAWIAQQEQQGMPPGFLRARISESQHEPTPEQTMAALDAIAGKFNYKNWADAKARAPDDIKAAIRRYAVTELNLAGPDSYNMLGKSRSAISKGVDQVDQEYIDRQMPTVRKLGDDVNENFADGKVKGKSRPGRVKRSGASCAGSVTDLRARAKKYGGERGRMYHWCANMKSGRKK
jgi:hypothetical protein